MIYRQVTVLRNYYATSDPDEFCFDKYPDAQEHLSAWLRDYYLYRKEKDHSSRVYPSDLLPQEHHNQAGHWRITVEFIPTGEED